MAFLAAKRSLIKDLFLFVFLCVPPTVSFPATKDTLNEQFAKNTEYWLNNNCVFPSKSAFGYSGSGRYPDDLGVFGEHFPLKACSVDRPDRVDLCTSFFVTSRLLCSNDVTSTEKKYLESTHLHDLMNRKSTLELCRDVRSKSLTPFTWLSRDQNSCEKCDDEELKPVCHLLFAAVVSYFDSQTMEAQRAGSDNRAEVTAGAERSSSTAAKDDRTREDALADGSTAGGNEKPPGGDSDGSPSKGGSPAGSAGPTNVGGNNAGSAGPTDEGGSPAGSAGPTNEGGNNAGSAGPTNVGGNNAGSAGPTNGGGSSAGRAGPTNEGGSSAGRAGPTNEGGSSAGRAGPTNEGGSSSGRAGPTNEGGSSAGRAGPTNEGGSSAGRAGSTNEVGNKASGAGPTFAAGDQASSVGLTDAAGDLPGDVSPVNSPGSDNPAGGGSPPAGNLDAKHPALGGILGDADGAGIISSKLPSLMLITSTTLTPIEEIDNDEDEDDENSDFGNQNQSDEVAEQNQPGGNLLTHSEEGVQSFSREEEVSFSREEEASSGHFMAYFITAIVLCVAGYVIYHNKQKILAIAMEGRRDTQRRRPNNGTESSTKYSKLQSTVEEVVPALEKSTTSKNYIY